MSLPDHGCTEQHRQERQPPREGEFGGVGQAAKKHPPLAVAVLAVFDMQPNASASHEPDRNRIPRDASAAILSSASARLASLGPGSASPSRHRVSTRRARSAAIGQPSPRAAVSLSGRQRPCRLRMDFQRAARRQNANGSGRQPRRSNPVLGEDHDQQQRTQAYGA